MKTCFVICPIGAEESDVRKRSDSLLNVYINKVCKVLDYEVVRADHIMSNDKIDQTILDYLVNSELVIADVTDSNPNVFYEVGYRTALHKPLIQIALENTPLPFDVHSTRTIYYTLTDVTKIDDIIERLKGTINTVEQRFSVIETTPNETSDDAKLNTLIFNALYDIKDSIDSLYPLIKARDNSIIKELIAATSSEIRKTTNDPMGEAMKEFFSFAMNDPSKASNFVEVFSKFPSSK